MGYTTVRTRQETHRILRDLARAQGTSLQAVLDQAIEDLRRKRFLEQLNRDFAALRADPEAWCAELQERFLYEESIADGLFASTAGFGGERLAR